MDFTNKPMFSFCSCSRNCSCAVSKMGMSEASDNNTEDSSRNFSFKVSETTTFFGTKWPLTEHLSTCCHWYSFVYLCMVNNGLTMSITSSGLSNARTLRAGCIYVAQMLSPWFLPRCQNQIQGLSRAIRRTFKNYINPSTCKHI